MQRTILLQSILGAASGHCILQVVGRLREEIDPTAFEGSWNRVASRHSALRTRFSWDGAADPRQIVEPEVRVPFEQMDLRGLEPAEQETRFGFRVEEDRRRGFDLEKAPLLRVTLVRIGETDHRLIWTVHHALVDGRSLVVVLEEVFALYQAQITGRAAELPPAASFENYVEWLLAQDISAHESFFREALAGIEPQVPLLFEGSRQRDVQAPGRVEAVVGPAVTAKLQALAKSLDVTIHTLAQAAWSAVLRRSQPSSGDDVVFGVERACRHVPLDGVGSMVGLLINALPLRATVTETTPLSGLVQDLSHQAIALRHHEHAPLASISNWLGVDKGRQLFRTLIVAENFVSDTRLGALGDGWRNRSFELLERSAYPSLGTRLDDQLHLHLLYEKPALDPRAAEWMVDHLQALLAAMPGDPERPLLALAEPGPVWDELVARAGVDAGRPVARELTAGERQQILVDWNETAADFPTDRLVHDLIGEQAAASPDALAVSDPDGSLSYRELDRRANQLAHHLRSKGVGPEVRVAVCMETSRELLIAYLGILRAGGAYVPIDPGNPHDRVRFVVEDSGAQALLTRPHLAGTFDGIEVPVLAFDSECSFVGGESHLPPETAVGPRNLVYVIYTSGSTGTPKGVLIEHRSLMNLVAVYHRRLEITAKDRTSMISGVAFDAAVVDIWPYLTVGASLHVPPQKVRMDSRVLVRWITQQQLDIVFTPTALGEAMFREDWSENLRLRTLLVGGDKLHGYPTETLPFALVNTYGPTECTVDSTWFTVSTGVEDPAPPPIGKPIENYRTYVVDGRMQPVPAGESGELLIGGVGVARGYLNRPELSQEVFIPDPFGNGPAGRLYRSGDLVRYREDGEIEISGRIDDQVQIRGFRVEPGEVAAVLSEHPDVDAVVVLAREDTPGRVRLVAYVASARTGADLVPALRDLAVERLPTYMVPTFVALDALPTNLNGKVDRKALQPPETYEGWLSDSSGTPPRDDVERNLVEIWKEILELDTLGIEDSFFDLGGDSLSVVTLLVAVEKESGVEVPLPALLREPTIQNLAQIVRGDADEALRPSVVLLQPDGSESPFFCVAGAGGGCHWFGELAKELRNDRPFLGLEPIRPEGVGLEDGIPATAAALIGEMKQVQPAGPYLIGGYSTGGMIAFEIAQQLCAAGDAVGLLALIEADGGRDYTSRFGQIGVFIRNLLAMDAARATRVILDRTAFALRTVQQRLGQSEDTRLVTARIDEHKQADEEALHAYAPSPYEGDLTLLACAERPMTAVQDEKLGWGDTIRGAIVVHKIPGDHYTMLGQPNVKILAEALQRSLDAAKV